jgi:hypothetical protein
MRQCTRSTRVAYRAETPEQPLNTAPFYASIPDLDSNHSGTNSPRVSSQFVLARDVEFSCADSLTFVRWIGSARGSF